MKLKEFDKALHTFFSTENYLKHDRSMNGIQVGDGDAEVRHVAFALDAGAAPIEAAVKAGADVLFVHHGLFWGAPLPITGAYYKRINTLITNKLALYAMHLPLDAHHEYGNNITVARRAGITTPESILSIGFGGQFEQPVNVYDLAEKVYGREGVTLWPFKTEVSRAAVIVGGAARMVYQLAEMDFDCFITGEVSHEIYHFCAESGISLIAGGHYQSEMYGLITFKAFVEQRWPALKTTLIDIPTGC
jgi:dinuclear metal center YbgI/SA1388 family protein